MRSLLAVVGALALLVSTVGGAAGARSFKEVEHIRDIGCGGLTTPDGTAEFYVSLSDLYGIDAYLDVWAGEPGDSELIWMRDFDRPVVATFGPTTVSATIPLLPAGEAQVVAELEPVEAISFTDSGKDGNSRYRFTVSGTAFAPTGTLTLPGSDPAPITAADCGASDVQVENFFNQPHASVRSWSSTGGFCQLTNTDGDTADVFMDVFEDDFLFLDAFVADAGGDQVSASGAGDIAGGGVSMTLDEYDPQTGEPTGALGSATVTLAESDDDVGYVLRASKVTLRVTGSLLDVSGTLTTSLGSFDLDPCIVAATRNKEIATPSNGPKPTAKRPVNDLPAGAVSLSPGRKSSTSTRGAQVPSEIAYPCMTFEDFDGTIVTIPVEHTVWYTVTGTGGTITVDTAGSDFDTVIAVYEGAADAGATVACVDDTPVEPLGRTLQAAVTFPTDAGTTYWIQIGGINESLFGPDPNVSYGNLRVAVR
jgi:hypothetical protein